MCKVSVLVPIYNVERYLSQCLDSLLAQTLSDIEIICIDDGSTDASASLLDTYAQKDCRIQVIHKENGGYGKALNTGLHLAKGEYIGIVESDDFAAPTLYESLYRAAVQHQAQIAKCNFYRYWSKPKAKMKKEPLLDAFPYHRTIHPWQYLRLFRIQPSIWSGIYERSFLEEQQISFLETPGAAYQDTSFTFKAFAAAERVVFLPDLLLYYRQDNENSSVRSVEKAFAICEEYQEINAFLKQKKEYRNLEPIRNEAMFHTYLWNYVRLKSDLCRTFLDQMQQDFLQLEQQKELRQGDFVSADARMLHMILQQPEQFWKKEQAILPLRQKIPNRLYRALLIGRTVGIPSMLQAVIKRLCRK